MKNLMHRARNWLISILRPDQRRNWSKDQVKHYRAFLDDFEKIKGVCDATVENIRIHDLLEKEIRNSYWIYRSSPIEQAVLIAKIVLRRVGELVKVGGTKADRAVVAARNNKPKALFVVSPATGIDSLANVATSSFEKEDVAFVCSGENSRVQGEIQRRGFPVLLADNPEDSKWRPCGNEVKFLKGLWAGLRSIDRLNYVQKLFVYLYTRSALKSLHSYRAFFADQLKGGGCQVFTGRPRTPFIAGAIVAGRECNAEIIFVSHTIWYKLPCPVGRLYDLSIFSGAILLTEHCKQEVQRVNPNVKAAVVGMAMPKRAPQDGQLTAVGNESKLRIGMFLGVNDFIPEILPRLAKLDVEIFLKTRPPGKNASAFSYLSDLYENVSICDHADFSMDRFCNSIDVVVGGYSNAVYSAACLGVPVVGFLTPAEKLYNEFLRPVLIPFDLAVVKVSDAEELIAEVSKISGAKDNLKSLSERQLQNASNYIPEVNFSPINRLLSRQG